MSNNLEVLAQNRNAILLAEVAGWLHDMGKCADEFITYQATDKPNNYQYKTAYSHLLPSKLLPIELLNETVTVKDLIEKAKPRIISDQKRPWIMRVLGRCHSAAHVEKELGEKESSSKQPQKDTRLSSAFGREGKPITGLTNQLKALPFASIQTPNVFIPKVQEAFSTALSDTRRPINEVTLRDWSSIVAAMFKAALAGALLGYQPAPDDLRWRLLSVRVDNLAFFTNVARIADLKARQEILSEAFMRVHVLLEENYPLGALVYRDPGSAVYIVPNLDDLLTLTDKHKTTLETLIREEFAKGTPKDIHKLKLALAGELVPVVSVDSSAWWGQKPQKTNVTLCDEVPPIAKILKSSSFTHPNPQAVVEWWSHRYGELCPVCRLRPMEERNKTCDTCRQRRASPIDIWEEKPAKTIWMDEIADHNDRVALLVGKFGLDDWLSGNLVKTMLVKAVENEPCKCVPKNPSPARLRRVWETTQRFWTDTTVEGILKQHVYAKSALRCRRLRVIPDRKTGWQEKVPYDGTINSGAISLLWRKAEEHFVTISNLQLAAGDAKSADELAQAWKGRTVTLSDPDNPRRTYSITVQEAKPAEDAMGRYAPYLPLLDSPDRFLALVPATDALAIAEKIRDAYTQEFGKVQNRLPLFLGLVFFQRKTPLMAVMDTARRMLDQVEFKEETWLINAVSNGKIAFRNGIEWSVPTTMGDGSPDVWYPYFFVEGDPGQRRLRFQYKSRWLVHVDDLQENDKVYVQPSHFAYIYLEHTAQRFRFEPEKDTVLLDELPKLTKMWCEICRVKDMSDTKLRGVADLLRVKGEMWGRDSEEWKNLIQTTLKEAGLLKNGAITVKDVLHGRFERCLDLHLRILKWRVKGVPGTP